MIRANELAAAQELRKTGATKRDIATQIGVDHAELADALAGVDLILNKATADTYSKRQYEDLETANRSLHDRITAQETKEQDHDRTLARLQELETENALLRGQVVTMPDGTTIMPDALAIIQNLEAELAAYRQPAEIKEGE